VLTGMGDDVVLHGLTLKSRLPALLENFASSTKARVRTQRLRYPCRAPRRAAPRRAACIAEDQVR